MISSTGASAFSYFTILVLQVVGSLSSSRAGMDGISTWMLSPLTGHDRRLPDWDDSRPSVK